MLSLSNVPADTRHTIKWCSLNGEEYSFAESVGLVPGAEVRVIASHWGNVIVSVGNVRLALGKDTAEKIKV